MTNRNTLLRVAHELIPQGIKVMLAADRFYGTAALISLCQGLGWQYRIRMKGNLHLFHHEGWVMSPQEAYKLGLKEIGEVRLGEKRPMINVGILQEPGHPEPWFIAMDGKPSASRVLDYGMRWGIEALFSDLKTRGFSITKIQLQHAERIERLLLVLTIAFYWAVSTGMSPPTHQLKSKKSLQIAHFFLQTRAKDHLQRCGTSCQHTQTLGFSKNCQVVRQVYYIP